HDVRVLEPRDQLGLADEVLDEPAVVGELREQALERDLAPRTVGDVDRRAMHRRHAACTETLVHGVGTEVVIVARPRGHGVYLIPVTRLGGTSQPRPHSARSLGNRDNSLSLQAGWLDDRGGASLRFDP